MLENRRMRQFCWEGCEKPIALEARTLCYPGPGTPLQSRLEEFEYSGKSPIPTVDIPDSIQQSDFGAPLRVPSKAKRNIKKYLMASQEFFCVGASRALEGGVGVFQMTNCEDGQVMGKGFACHFLQFVPTCL